MNELGQRIYDERKKKGLSQADLAAAISVSPKAVSKWETGEAQPTLENVSLLAKVFNVTTDYLLNGIVAHPDGTVTKDNFSYLEEKKATRKKLRVWGFTIGGIGVTILLIGLILFVSPMASISMTGGSGGFDDSITGFVMFGVGGAMTVVGAALLMFGYMGSMARFTASETAPVAKDTYNYMAQGTRAETVKTVQEAASVIKDTVGSDKKENKGTICLKCGTLNEVGAAFCDNCGAPLTKKCSKCGEINDADAKFCRKCGEPLE